MKTIARPSQSFRAACNLFLSLAAPSTKAARRAFVLSSLAVLFCLALGNAGAALVRIGPFTNSMTLEANTNDVLVVALSGPVANADGSFTTIGLPLRLKMTADGSVTNRLAQNNYLATNAYLGQGIVFRVPQDNGANVYSMYDLRISGYNTFVTIGGVSVTNVTFDQITNSLGGNPILTTALPSLTNGFIRLLEATNVANALVNSSSNALYSDYTTKIAVISALTFSSSNFLYGDYTTKIAALSTQSITNAYATNSGPFLYTGQRLYVPTNYDALGTALAIGLQATNYTIATSNNLYSLITIGSVTAAGVTNIFDAKIAAPSNTLASLSITNAYATNSGPFLYTGQRLYVPTNYDALGTALAIGLQATNYTIATSNNLYSLIGASGISPLTATNISTNQVYLGTNNIGIASSLSAFVPTNRFEISGAAAIKANTNKPTIWNAVMAGNSTNLGTAVWPNSAGGSTAVNSNNVMTIGMGADSLSSFSTDHIELDNPLWLIDSEIDVSGGGTVIDSSGNYHGGLTLASNLPAAGLSTNGSIALQVPASIGGVTVWTNVTSLLGSTLATTNPAALLYTNMLPGFTNTFVTIQQGSARLLTVSNLLGVGPVRFSSSNLAGFFPLWWDYLGGDVLIINHTTGAAAFAHTNASGTLQSVSMIKDSHVGFFNVASTIPNLANVSFDWTFDTNGGALGTLYAQLTTNGFWANKFIGNGSGLINSSSSNLEAQALGQVTNVVNSLAVAGSTVSLTNAYGTNYPNQGVSNRVLFYPTNDLPAASNALYAAKVNTANGIATGLNVTNLALEANVSFGATGQATNIFGSSPTNYLLFINAGESSVTNGPFVWISSLNVYSNFISGDWMTNNGSATLVKSNTVTLYSLAGANPIGAYSAINGISPTPTAVATARINASAFAWEGFLTPANLNAISNAILTAAGGGGGGGTPNAIPSTNGFGLNPTLQFTNAGWGYSNSYPANTTRVFEFAIGGLSNSVDSSFSSILGGFGNKASSGGSFNHILGGYSNSLSESAVSTIVAGQFNRMSVANYGFISSGESNRILGSGSTAAEFSAILGGFGNTITLPSGSTLGYSMILGGSNNLVNVSYGIAAGVNAQVTNANSFVFSDGNPTGNLTNSSFIIQATNGVGINTNYPAGFALNVNGAVNASSLSVGGNVTIQTFSNSGPASFLGAQTNFGNSYLRQALATSGQTNVLLSDSVGKVFGTDLATLVASIAAGGGAFTPWPSDIAGAGHALTGVGALRVTGGITNDAATASTAAIWDANKKLTSLANPGTAGNWFQTNNGTGGFGYAQLLDASALKASQYTSTDANTNLVSTQNGNQWTNLIAFTHEGTTTNINVTFNGTFQSFTVTNGPDIFITAAGAGGSASFRIKTNSTLHLPAQVQWLSGSNNVSTNGVLTLTCYGGTNEMVAAMKGMQ